MNKCVPFQYSWKLRSQIPPSTYKPKQEKLKLQILMAKITNQHIKQYKHKRTILDISQSATLKLQPNRPVNPYIHMHIYIYTYLLLRWWTECHSKKMNIETDPKSHGIWDLGSQEKKISTRYEDFSSCSNLCTRILHLDIGLEDSSIIINHVKTVGDEGQRGGEGKKREERKRRSVFLFVENLKISGEETGFLMGLGIYTKHPRILHNPSFNKIIENQ